MGKFCKILIVLTKPDQAHWSEDMTKWPELQFGDVYTYLINTEGQFMKEKQKHTSLWKPFFALQNFCHTHIFMVSICKYTPITV